ncbi:carboxypeptidase-like regulatory domain-containing protein [Flavobacterium sp.]|uniref:TonB-dependent receptor n=1 Tax=Flavobacterium sp. TaxID=239 RepID=UPI0037537D9F
MKFKLSILGVFFTIFSFAQNGTISGTVTDKDLKDEPLPFANVTIKGTSNGATTDINGKYAIDVPAGNHIVVFSFLGYISKEVVFTIVAGEKKTINQSIGSGSVTMKDVVVKASISREKETALLLDQKKAVEIKQSIGAQEMSRKGVSDVEEGLTKITGITKVDGRGLFVRGLEDRYNNLLINDLAVPSNNPFKKIIPLDIFPTDIVSIIESYKTFNTNLYGDFAGGTFNIITSKGDKSQTKINFGTSFVTNNNLENFLVSKDANSSANFFGIYGNKRNLSATLGIDPASRTDQRLTKEESLTGFGSGFDVDQSFAPLNTSFGISHSEKFNLGKNKLQYLLALNFDNKYQFRQGLDRFFNLGQGNYDNDLISTQYKYATNTSAIVALNYKSDRFSLTSNTLYLKSTESMIQDQVGSTNGASTNKNAFIRLNQLQNTSFLNTQLLASYKLTENEKHNVKGGVSYTKTGYELPDRKSFKGFRVDDNSSIVNYSGSGLFRQFVDIDGKFHVSGLLEYDWKFGNEDLSKAHKLTFGYNGYANRMQTKFRFFVSDRLTSSQVAVPTNTLDQILADNLEADKFFYREGTNATYKAKLFEYTNAGYFDLALKFSDTYEMNFGVRAERFYRKITYKETGNFDDDFLYIKNKKLYFLPTLNMKYKFNENSNLRFAGSKSYTRPVIMEGYPLEFVNLDGTIEEGNENLKNSDNYNFDLKYELFPTNKELFAVTAFSKLIQKPIERVFKQNAGSGGQIITYQNSEKAILYGAELEFLLQLEKISKNLSSFSLGFNTSLMYTKVNIDPSNVLETKPERRLQGASPWLINADVKYEFEFSQNWTNTISLVNGVYGKRIYAVGTGGLDHYYELPFNKLDFIWNSKISKNWDAKFSVDNILNPNYQIRVGDESTIRIDETDLTVKDYKKGVGFSLNLGYTF